MRTMLRAVLTVGVPVSGMLFLLCAAVYTWTDLPFPLLRAAAVLPVLCGSYFAAYTAGRRLRVHAMRRGAETALLLTVLWYLAAVLRAGKLLLPYPLLLTLPCGAVGGVLGAEKAQPMPRRRLHRHIPAKTRLQMLPLLLHTPKKPSETHQAET